MIEWYWLNTTYACGAIAVEDGIIVDACPIYRKHIGRPAKSLGNELKRKGLFLDAVVLNPNNSTTIN